MFSAALLLVLLLVISVLYLNNKPAPEEPPLTEEDIKLIQSTWEIVKTLPTEAVAVILFKNIFSLAGEGAADLAQLFPFGRKPGFSVDKLDNDELFKPHGVKVVSTVTVAISMLTKLDELVPVLKDLGKKHTKYGVVSAHYSVVGGAFIATLAQGLPPQYWNSDVKGAFLKMWGVVASTMQSEE